MTPDMKRLCDAVKASWVSIGALGLRDPQGVELICGTPEAIVRAVLMELREPSEEMAEAGGSASVQGGPRGSYNVDIGESAAEGAFIAMIDHVLAERSAA